MVMYKVTAEIQGPIEQAWEVLSTVESWPEWLPTVETVEVLDGAPLKLGARFRLTQPKLRPTVWTVTELKAFRQFTWRAKSPGVEMFADHKLEQVSAVVTRVHLRFEFKGWLGRLLGIAFGAITRDYLAKEAQALKLRTEAVTP
jgi:uncharacterized membrane protein